MKVRVLLVMTLVLFTGCTTRPGRDKSRLEDLQGIDELRQNNPKGAIVRLKQHLASKPRDDMGWTILGHCHEDLDEDEEAEAAYQKALEINPRRVQALTGMGILCRKKRDYDQAQAYYEKAIAIDPKYARPTRA